MQREYFLYALIILLFLFLFITFAQNVSIRNDNQGLVNAFFTNQRNLIEVCKIDYNDFLAEQQKKYYRDLNTLIYKEGYRVG